MLWTYIRKAKWYVLSFDANSSEGQSPTQDKHKSQLTVSQRTTTWYPDQFKVNGFCWISFTLQRNMKIQITQKETSICHWYILVHILYSCAFYY